MKTIESIKQQLENNHQTIQSLLNQLQQLHYHNSELTETLLALQTDNQSKLEEEDTTNQDIQPCDRVVVLSPDRNRRGLTGHIDSRTEKTASFRADDNKTTFSVRTYNLFKLKRKSKHAK